MSGWNLHGSSLELKALKREIRRRKEAAQQKMLNQHPSKDAAVLEALEKDLAPLRKKLHHLTH